MLRKKRGKRRELIWAALGASGQVNDQGRTMKEGYLKGVGARVPGFENGWRPWRHADVQKEDECGNLRGAGGRWTPSV